MFKNLPYGLACLLLMLLAGPVWGQGCVAIRHFSSCGAQAPGQNFLGQGDWQVGMTYRYFKSFRHFRGTHEEPDRVTNETEVINHAHAWDFVATYGLNDRWFASLVLPMVINTRSSLYEHGRNERNTTYSRGLADSRLSLGYWLRDPAQAGGFNASLALGVKLPTGNYHATDIFYNVGPEGSSEVRPVDQSIQPGDGGFGATLEVQLLQQWSGGLSLFASGFYLANPRETNGVRTFRETLSPILNNEAIMSVPDQYGLRAGLNYTKPGSPIAAMLGARFEGIPVRDLIGGSAGFRRPGMVLSVEPGLSWGRGPLSVNVSVPVALLRARPQSVTDLETEAATGQPRQGDAAFADYLLNIGLVYRLARPASGMTWPGVH
ncbi:MAG: hypothetical protein D6722_25255 [Bacteroidetes bacterium]|nr:MAG: hypothetical protein D6722_25255 [Bacteroidota bacterium]